MAAESEEVCGDTDSLKVENSGPDLGEGFFRGAPRGDVCLNLGEDVGRGKRLAVDLAIRRKRQGFKHHEDLRGHVLGQGGQQVSAKRRRRNGLARLWDDIAHQKLVAGLVFACDDDGIANRRMAGQRRFDLAQFNAESADFYLVVGPAHVLHVAVREPAAEVAGAIHPRVGSGCERIENKALGGHLRLTVVASREAIARKIKLTWYPNWKRLAGCIENVGPRVGERPSDGDCLAARHQRVGGVGGVLRGAVQVVHAPYACGCVDLLYQFVVQRLAREVHNLDRIRHVPLTSQLRHGGGNGIDQCHLMLCFKLREIQCVLCNHNLAARAQRDEDLEDRQIEADGGR